MQSIQSTPLSPDIPYTTLSIISGFPRAKNGDNYLSLADGRRIFFKIFIRKYGIDGTPAKYTYEDVIRRIRLVEFFDSFFKGDFWESLDLSGKSKKIILESHFHRIVIVETHHKKLELLSFYPYKN
jgi:hypothetical protein